MTDKPAPHEVEIAHPDYQPSKAEWESWGMRSALWSDVGFDLSCPSTARALEASSSTLTPTLSHSWERVTLAKRRATPVSRRQSPKLGSPYSAISTSCWPARISRI